MSTRRLLIAVAAAAVVCVGHRGAVGGGTIETSGATVEAGAAPTQGTVTIDPNAPAATLPAAAPLAAQGTITGSLPPKPGVGSGTLGVVQIDSDMTLPGGTYEYEVLFVEDGATVTFTGPVTLLATDSMYITGNIETTADNAPITIVVESGFSVQYINPGPRTGVRTFGAASPITIDGGRVEVGVTTSTTATLDSIQSDVTTLDGDITLRAHADPAGIGLEALDIQTTEVRAGNGSLTMLAQSFAFLNVSQYVAEEGGVVIQSFGSDITTFSDITVQATRGDVVFEAATGIDLAFDNSISASNGDVRLEAFGGDLRLSNGFQVTADDGAAVVQSLATGEIVLAARDSIELLDDAGGVNSIGEGGAHVRAHGGSATVEGEWTFTCTDGPIAVSAAGDVTVGPKDGGLGPQMTSIGVDIVAAGGEASLDVSQVDAGTHALRLHSDATATLEGALRSDDLVSVQTVTGSILLPGANVTTDSGAGGRSGDISLESFGGGTATIDASGATVRSGDDATRSGAVELLIHAPLVDSFVLPKNIKVKINESKPEKSSLVVAGFFDTGAAAADLAGPATLTIGGLTFAADLVAKGRKVQHKANGLQFSITPQRSGSSRAKFKLKFKGDLAGKIDPDAALTLRFDTASAQGRGTVGLEAGTYKLGKRRGTLSEPGVFPFKSKATHKGTGSDKLALLAGLATSGGTPAAAPDVTVRYGDVFDVTIPGNELTKGGDVFSAKSPASAPEVSLLKLDYRKERLTLKGKGLDLGALPGGPTGVAIEVSLGSDTRAVQVRMAPQGKSLKY